MDLSVDRLLFRGRLGDQPWVRELRSEAAVPPRDAFFAPADTIPLGKAVGRISVEPATPYSPGIPSIASGERFSSAVIRYLTQGLSLGMYVSNVSDPELETIKVVREG